MTPNAYRIVGGLLVITGLAIGACAGEGTGLDEFGNPLGPQSTLEPTLESIQANIFTPICTQCHTGASAPLGLPLDTGQSFSNLVGVPSVEIPALLRVAPGNPDSSYIIWKVEGRSGIVGGRMPLGLQRLSDEQIRAIWDWIAAGANP